MDLTAGVGLELSTSTGYMQVDRWAIIDMVRAELRGCAPRVHGSDYLVDLIRDIVAAEVHKIIAERSVDVIEL